MKNRTKALAVSLLIGLAAVGTIAAEGYTARLKKAFAAKPKIGSTGEEMKVGSGEGVLEEKHFAPAEIAQWEVLVIDSYNCERTQDWLSGIISINDGEIQSTKNQITKAVAQQQNDDLDWKQAKRMQDLRLKKVFKNVHTTRKDGQKYDLLIIRDWAVDLPKGGANVDLIYWFVYDITPDMLVTGDLQYVYRGAIKTRKFASFTPYPNYSLGVQNANQMCINELDYLLEAGLDLMSKK